MAGNYLRSIFNPCEEEINFYSFLKFSQLIFRFFSFDLKPLGENASVKEKIVRSFKISYFRFVLVTAGMAVVMYAMYGLVNLDNFFLAASSVPNANCILLILLKGLSTFIHRGDIWNICKDLAELMEKRTIVGGRRDMKPFLDEYHRVMKIYSTPFLLVSLPVVFPIFSFVLFGEMNVPLHYWYPVDIYRVEVFPLALIWINWIAWNGLFMLMAADSLLYALITVIVMEFDILRDEFARLSLVPENDKMKKVQELTDRHNKLLFSADKLQSIYGLTFLYSFVISSLIICFIAFQMSTATNFIDAYAFNAPYLGMMVGQVFILCLFGQKLIDSSLGVADGVYDCGWEAIRDNKLKKSLILIILRSNRPKQLTAMGFADISLPSFTTIMTTTGSYFSLLKNVYSG